MESSYEGQKVSAPAAGISIREFARREGCDDKLVRRALKEGKLKAFEDGSLDPDLVKTGWRRTNRRADMSADTAADSRSADRPRTARKLSAPAAAAEGLATAVEEGDSAETARQLQSFIDALLSGSIPDQAQSERVKEGALALLRVLEARQKAGALIDLATAETVIFDSFRATRDAWTNWPDRVGPLIAADLEIPAERLIEALKAHVHEHLRDLGEPEPEFGG